MDNELKVGDTICCYNLGERRKNTAEASVRDRGYSLSYGMEKVAILWNDLGRRLTYAAHTREETL